MYICFTCRFIEEGGWTVLNEWLQEIKNTTEENSPVLIELLKVYQVLPVSVTLLKLNSCAKTIKTLSKSEDSGRFSISLLILHSDNKD